MPFFEIYTIAAIAIFGLMTVLWIVSLILKGTGIVDIFWGTGFIASNWLYFALTPAGFPTRKWLISTSVTIWRTAALATHPTAQLGQTGGLSLPQVTGGCREK